MEEIVVKIVNVFVDALPHVPEHRRLPILVQLVDTLGAKRFLWVLLLLLFEQYVTKTVLVAAYGEKVRIKGGGGGRVSAKKENNVLYKFFVVFSGLKMGHWFKDRTFIGA